MMFSMKKPVALPHGYGYARIPLGLQTHEHHGMLLMTDSNLCGVHGVFGLWRVLLIHSGRGDVWMLSCILDGALGVCLKDGIWQQVDEEVYVRLGA